jgi:glycosyltransferase involved in cell wall biosynthesis
VPLAKEILLVDDASTDGSRELLARMEGQPGVRVFYHETNRGKGAALRTAFQHATGDVVLVQDADLEYDPLDYPRLLQPIAEGRADVVFGSRFQADGPHRVLYFWHSVASRWLTGADRQGRPAGIPDLRDRHQLRRPHLPGGEKDRPAGRVPSAVVHTPLLEMGLRAHEEVYCKAAGNDTSPKRKRGSQAGPSLALRATVDRLISNRECLK